MKLKPQSPPILKPSTNGVWRVDLRKMLFPADYEFVPNITDIFEWELAFMERKSLSPKEMVERSAMFSRIAASAVRFNGHKVIKPLPKVEGYFVPGSIGTIYPLWCRPARRIARRLVEFHRANKGVIRR